MFVNVSRGAIVQNEALFARLERATWWPAWRSSTLSRSPRILPIRELRNVFLTPHTAAATKSTRTRNFKIMVDELERFFNGHETRFDLLPRTIANRTGAAPPRRG